MNIQKEQFLAESLQNGDKYAYEQLYCNLFDGAMCYLSKTFDLSKNDAYDIVSSVFAKLPNIIDKYDSTQDFIKWFHTVVNNSARDYMKKESRSIPVEPELLMQYIADAESNNEKDFEQIERATRLRQIIAELSDKQCIATTLHYLHGFTVAETAEQMKIRPATVKEYLSRAKKAITKKVKMEGDRTHWLGGLIPKISAEITSKFEYFMNAGIEAKTVVVTMTAAAVVSGTVIPAHINDVKVFSLQPPATQQPQEEITATEPQPQSRINVMPIEQRHVEIKQIPIAEAQEKSETPMHKTNVEVRSESDKGWGRSQNKDSESRSGSDENRDEPHSQQEQAPKIGTVSKERGDTFERQSISIYDTGNYNGPSAQEMNDFNAALAEFRAENTREPDKDASERVYGSGIQQYEKSKPVSTSPEVMYSEEPKPMPGWGHIAGKIPVTNYEKLEMKLYELSKEPHPLSEEQLAKFSELCRLSSIEHLKEQGIKVNTGDTPEERANYEARLNAAINDLANAATSDLAVTDSTTTPAQKFTTDEGEMIFEIDKSLVSGENRKLTDLIVVYDGNGNRIISSKSDSNNIEIQDNTEHSPKTNLTIAHIESGNRFIPLKNDSNDGEIQDDFKSFNNLEKDAETIDEENDLETPDLQNDDSIEFDFEPEENTLDCEESEETAELPQDTESSLSTEESPDGGKLVTG